MADDTLTLDVVSDVVCPWCYVGKRRLEKALALVPDIPTEIRWRPYQLAPELPPVSPDWSPVAVEETRGYNNSAPTPPRHAHTPIMAADGRVWETGCGCGV